MPIEHLSSAVADTIVKEAQNRAGYVQDPAIRRPPVMRTVDLDELQSEGSKRAAKGRRKKAWGTINRWSAKHNWIASQHAAGSPGGVARQLTEHGLGSTDSPRARSGHGPLAVHCMRRWRDY